MKSNLILIFLFFIYSLSSAQNFSISNVVLDPSSPSTLLPNARVNITYDYSKIGGDIRIGAYPIGGSTAGTSGYALKTDATGTGEAYFIVNNGGNMTGIKFEFVDLDWTLLYDTLIAVDYTCLEFSIKNLQLNPASPAVLSIGDTIKYNFDYKKADIDVKIVPRALSNKMLTAKQLSSDSPVYTGLSGSGNGFIKIDSLASVDQIMFQFINAATNDTIVEILERVFYSFTNDIGSSYAISNVAFDPPSPGNIALNEKVNISYDYTKPYGDVRISVSPIVTEGSSNSGTSGSPLFTENTGSGNGFFVFFDEAIIEKVRFRVQSISEIALYELDVDVLYTVLSDPNSAYSITNVVFDPAPPIEVYTHDTIKFTFDYNSPFGNFKIFARPFENSSLKIGYTASESELVSNKSGSGEGFIIYEQPSSFDQIRFQFQTLLGQSVYETFVDANFTISTSTVSTDAFKGKNEMLIYPNPAKDNLFIYSPKFKEFEYSLVDLRGRILLNGRSMESVKELDIQQIKKGLYIVQIINEDQNFSKLIVIE